MERPGQTEQSHSPESVIDLASAELVQSVFRTANALLASPTEAEEVALDALVKLHKKLTELAAGNGKESTSDVLAGWLEGLPAWLDQIAVSKSKSRAPKRKRHSRKLEELGHLHEHASERENAKQVTAVVVKELLTYLPGRHRFVYVLAVGLGHTHARVGELLDLEQAAVARTLGVVESKLGEFGAHAPIAKAMFMSMSGGGPSPLHDYMRVFGGPDPATEARVRRRFESHLREGTGHLELSGDSFHAGQFSGSHFSLEAIRPDSVRGRSAELESGITAPNADAEPESEPGLPESELAESAESELGAGGRRVGLAWGVAAIACVGVVVLAVSQVRMTDRLAALDEKHQERVSVGAAQPDDLGPPLLEPGSFAALEHGSRAEPSKDAIAKLVRSDAKGAEIALSAGSISLHAKQFEGARWIVHAGRYDITATAARFRVTFTQDIPEVEVFQGKVRVTGGLFGADGVEVTSASETLAAMMATSERALPLTAAPGAPGVTADSAVGAPGADPQTYEDPLAYDEMFGRAVELRATKPDEAEALFRRLVELGRDDWVTERAFEQLRTLVAPDQREALRQAYVERFTDGMFAEPFGALGCQALDEDEADSCWVAFAEAFPNSLYGP
jgi:DNA-directed RNA polymerase specialized sigma24 family protein